MSPYIPLHKRKTLFSPQSAGELNFCITKLVHDYIIDYGLSYQNLNEVIGALECAKQELYRIVVAPYEDKKRFENGPVSKLDAITLENVR